jgi:uncharacterized protein (DUF427 family)
VGLSWQQGPLSPGAVGTFLVPEPLPKRLLYAEPLRRRMRVRFGAAWIADRVDALLLFEPGHYPMAYFREADVSPGAFERTDHTTRRADLGLTPWYTVRAGDKSAARGAWRHTEPPSYANQLRGGVAFARPAMDAFYEEGRTDPGTCRRPLSSDRYPAVFAPAHSSVIVTASSPIRSGQSCSMSPVLLRAGVLRADIDESALTPVEHQTFCPYKGLCSHYDTDDAPLAAWSYRDAYSQAGRISDLASFKPDIVSVELDGVQLRLEPGQTVIPHGPDRDLDVPAATGKQT